jgi:hypothetical protein
MLEIGTCKSTGRSLRIVAREREPVGLLVRA